MQIMLQDALCIHINKHTHYYMYICVCVCVCMTHILIKRERDLTPEIEDIRTKVVYFIYIEFQFIN